jgi:poly(glycerol-phosphate) alpha-glucosyltransferase
MLDSWAMRRAPWKKAIAAYLYENTHLRHASCLHALCDAEAQSIRRLRFDNPICIIPNGVMLPVITHDSGPAPWRDRIPADAKVMLFLGRLHRKKNLSALIEAWPENPDAHNWHLVIAGWDQGGHQEALAHLIGKRNLNGRVLLIGPLFGKLKDSALRNAHAFVLPSLSEGLPMAVLEAWSYGLPILMTDACNLPEGFEASAAARLSLNLDEMVRDLGRFLKKNPTDLQRMGRNGRQLVESRFNWDDVARAFLAVYEWIANGAERPSTVRIM